MPNPYGAPEISVADAAAKLKDGETFRFLDVREKEEVTAVSISAENVDYVPLSELGANGLDSLPEAVRDQNAEIVVFCHHGMRSAQVVAWLRKQGWQNVVSMAGGIDAYAADVDPSIGFY